MILILVPVVASVNEHKSKVLSLFCDIEDSAVTKLALRCEKFLFKLQSSENADDVDSTNEELFFMTAGEGNGFKSGSKEDEDSHYKQGSGGNGERKKRAKNMTKTNKLFYLKFILGIAIIEIYFAYSYSSVRTYASTT